MKEQTTIMRSATAVLLAAICILSSGCANKRVGQTADLLNPFAEGDSDSALGNRNNDAILGGEANGKGAEQARQALEVMGSYRAAQAPEPAYPVVQPAEVRLMWVPDHLTKTGDLVPAHYYYLMVLRDRWAVQDAFDLEAQLQEGSSVGSTPWIYKSGR